MSMADCKEMAADLGGVKGTMNQSPIPHLSLCLLHAWEGHAWYAKSGDKTDSWAGSSKLLFMKNVLTFSDLSL